MNLLEVWNIFKNFSGEKVSCDEAALMFECGNHYHQKEGIFYTHFIRQFTHNDHIDKITIEVLFEGVDQLCDLEFGLIHLEDNQTNITNFFKEVENLYEFQEVLKFIPQKINIIFNKI